MSLIANFLANAKTFDVDTPYIANDRPGRRFLVAWLASRPDIDSYGGDSYAAANAVWSLPQWNSTPPTGGTWTIKLTAPGISTIETAAIAYNANAATIEGAIDTAVTTAGTVTGWTNGDISVANDPLTSPSCTLTFDGTSVAQTNWTVELDISGLTGGTGFPSVITTYGQPNRSGLGLLLGLNLVSGAFVGNGASVSSGSYTRVAATQDTMARPPEELVKSLIAQLEFEGEHPSVVADCEQALGLPERYWPFPS